MMSFKFGNSAIRKFVNVAASLLLAIAVFANAAAAESRVECSAIRSQILKTRVAYCAMLPPSYDADKTKRFPVLYYLHGMGDNEESLVNGGGWSMYLDLLAQKKVGEYIIVTPNGFRNFYVNSRDGKFRYEDFFLKEFMPQIERKYRIKATRAGRGIMGVSMGGYGAFHYAFKYPQMFTSLSAHMPALRESLPPEAGGLPEARMMTDIFGNPIDAAYFRQNSPFTYARTQPAAALKKLSIYFDVGRSDRYDFDSGSEALHKILDQRGILNEFHIYPGGHNWEFVINHFEASLLMHSKAFGLSK